MAAKRLKTARKLSHDAYSVGWVCVLRCELNASRVLLDEEHERLPPGPKDDNTYLLGLMGRHNVVIAFPGSGALGTNAAARTATNMVRTFQNVRFCLMVGVGGGAPSPPDIEDPLKDIRLGDVVVSSPKGGHGGVLQYDMGKWEDSTEFTIKSHLNKPPSILLSAVELLKSDHDFGQAEMMKYIDHVTERSKRFSALKDYRFPGRGMDQLFKADTVHAGGEDCSDCDPMNLEGRLERQYDEPVIHYGLIASGNAVVRSAQRRDKLRDTFGISCFEMEAAGLMDNLPCLVIRGICDYSDEHKHKFWQPYASVVASAYAKDLLRVIHPEEVSENETAARLMEQVAGNLHAVKEDVSRINSAMQGDQKSRILSWLTQVDYGPQQSDLFSQQQRGTGQWLLHSNEFREWLDQPSRTLFCEGIPGAGKTIMTSIIINYLHTLYPNDDIGVAYIYCNFRQQYEQTPADILASLLKQLTWRQSSALRCVTGLYERHKDKNTRPSLEEISEALHTVASQYQKVFIIMDALDECQISGGGRTKLLSEIFQLQERAKASLLATSRFVADIKEQFQRRGSNFLEIRARDEDVQIYLEEHMSLLPPFVSRDLNVQNEVKVAILKAVDGMFVSNFQYCGFIRLMALRFLLAKLHLDSLQDKISPRSIRTALRNLPKGSGAYDQAYNEAMGRIRGQMPGFRNLAVRVLSWIACAKRPLTTLELQHALSVEIGMTTFDKENIPETGLMASVCAGLIRIDENSDIIRLVHYTLQEYFERTENEWFENAQEEIVKICLTYLSFDTFETGTCPSDKAFEDQLKDFPLYDYAAKNWGYHAQVKQLESEKCIVAFFGRAPNLSASIQAMEISETYSGYSQLFPKRMNGLHVSAYFGLHSIIQILLEKGYDPNARDSYSRTPLLIAAAQGQTATVKLLLRDDTNVRLNERDIYHRRTPLFWALVNGHDDILRALVAKNNVKLNYRDINGQTPLSWASNEGNGIVVTLLLGRSSIQPNMPDRNTGRTPLMRAAFNGNCTIVEELLRSDKVDPNCKDLSQHTALSLAQLKGHEGVLRLLLDSNRIALGSNHQYLQHRIFSASQKGLTATVKQALDHGVDPNTMDADRQTPLGLAFKGQHLAVAELLLERGANASPKDTMHGRISLTSAAAGGHEAVVKLLLEKGADPNPWSSIYGRSPLSWAAAGGYIAVVRLLLEKGANPNSWDQRFTHTPLSWAASGGHEAVVNLLLETGANPDSCDAYRRTPLSWAASAGNEAVVKLLLEKSANPNSKDQSGLTPLSLAASGGHSAVVKLLLENGASPPPQIEPAQRQAR